MLKYEPLMGRRVAARLKKLIDDAHEQQYAKSKNEFEVGDFVSLYAAESEGTDVIEPGEFCIVIKCHAGRVTVESLSDSTIRVTTDQDNCYKPS
tara:strand:+ start:2127 stop:2408 length:282 start_codon:yes stop_codon:yes gene_type:complete